MQSKYRDEPLTKVVRYVRNRPDLMDAVAWAAEMKGWNEPFDNDLTVIALARQVMEDNVPRKVYDEYLTKLEASA